MFFPIGDTPNPRGFRPWVNWTLIALNVAIYVTITLPLSLVRPDPKDPAFLEFIRLRAPEVPWWALPSTLQDLLENLTAYDLFVFAHGYKPKAPEISDLFTCMFLHGGLAHLLGNMLFLWIFGDNVEHRLGRLGYILTYLGTGIFATWTFAFFARDSMTPLVGASGAISGVIGVYYLLFPRNRVRAFVFLFPFFWDVWLIPVRLVIGFYIVVDNLLPFVLGAESNVAYGAHLGGFIAGLLVGWLSERPWLRVEKAVKRVAAQGRPGPGEVLESPMEALVAAIRSSDRERAFQALSVLEREDVARLSPEECATLAAWLSDAGFPYAAIRLLRQYIAQNPRSDSLAKIYLALGLIRLEQGQQAAAFQHLLTALEHNPDPETEGEIRKALMRLDLDRRLLKY